MRDHSFLQGHILKSAAGKISIAVTLKIWERDEYERDFSRSADKYKNWLLKNRNRWGECMPVLELVQLQEKTEEMQRKTILCTCLCVGVGADL